ncbi:ABC transporter permease, partial [Pseudomonadota bacterium]
MFIERFGHNVDLFIAFTEKEIKARYKRAVFGLLWIIINPLLQMVVIGFVLSFFIKIDNYYPFLFSGLLFWNFTSSSLSTGTSSIVYSRDLLKKAKFPREALVLSIVFANFYNLLISIGLFGLYLMLTSSLLLPNIFLLAPALLWLLFLVSGLCLLTSSLNVRFRD